MPKKNYKYLNQKEFADLAGITQGAVSGHLKRGNLVWAENENGYNDGINPDDPLNREYLKSVQGMNPGNRAEVQAVKGAGTTRSGSDNYLQASAETKSEKAETEKIERAIKSVKLAEMQKKVIPREYVVFFWNTVNSALHNYIANLGARIAPDIAAICEVSDPVMEGLIRDRLEEELLQALASVRNDAEGVPDVLGLSG